MSVLSPLTNGKKRVEQNDEATYRLLQSQLEVEQESNAIRARQLVLAEQVIAQAQLDAKRLQLDAIEQRVSERRRIRTSNDTNKRIKGLEEKILKVFLTIYGIDESLNHLAEQIDRQNQVLLILMAGKGNGNAKRAAEITQDLEIDHLRFLLLQETRNLQELEGQAVQFGISVPLITVNQMRTAKNRIEDLSAKIEAHEEKVK